MPMPWETTPSEAPKGNGMPWETAPAQDEWKPTPYGFKVKDAVTPDTGKPTVMREGGGLWYGPEQGNKGKPGWFDAKGMRLGATPQAETGFMDRFTNDLTSKAQAQSKMPLLGQVVPAPIAGMTKGLVDTVMAPTQLVGHATGLYNADPAVNAIQQNYEQNWQQSPTGEMIGQSIPFLATAGGSSAITAPTKALTAAERIRQALTTISKASATGASASAGLSPEVGVTSEGDFWNRKKTKATVGGLVGGGLGTAGVALEGAANAMSRPLTPEAQAVADLGDRFGVRTLAPDLATNTPGMAKTAVLAESIPGSGMVTQRVAQQQEARAAAEKLLAQHGIQGDTSEIIQNGLASNLAKGKANARGAYDEVAKLADGLGDVPLDTTLKAIQNFKAKQASAAIPDEGLIGLLSKMEARLKGVPPKETLVNAGVDAYGTPIIKSAVIEQGPPIDRTYTGIRGLRSDLGDMISDYYKGTNAATGSKGVQVLQGIKRAAESDLDAFAANNGPQLASAAKRADSIYKEQVLPYRNKIIANAIKSKEPDQIYKTMIAQGNGDRAENFYKALSPQGQAAVRSQMVKDAFEQATKVDGVFSPAQFAKSLENIKDSTGVFFKGQDKFELDGFTNLMRHIQRAGQVNENPPNGQRILMGLLGGEAVHGIGSLLGHGPEAAAAAFGSMAVGSAGSRALTKLFSSNAGKSLLLGASTMKPGSPAMERLIEKDLPRLLGASPNSNVTPFQPIPKAAGTSDSQIAEK